MLRNLRELGAELVSDGHRCELLGVFIFLRLTQVDEPLTATNRQFSNWAEIYFQTEPIEHRPLNLPAP